MLSTLVVAARAGACGRALGRTVMEVGGSEGLAFGGQAPAFVGRDEALAVLGEELAAAAGGPRIVWVEGEAGIGKTSLVRRFLAGAGASTHVVVWVSAAEEECSLAFGVIDALGRELGVGGADVSRLARAADGAADPFAVGAELLGALGDIDGLVVLVIDDVHWADVETARALLFALRRLEGEALLVVLLSRVDPWARLGEGWHRLVNDPARVRRILLGGLAAHELAGLAAAIGNDRLDLAAAERLHAHTKGHPLHALALLEELGAARLNATHDVLPAPRSLAALIVAKVAGLEPRARDLVAAAAVVGTSAPLATVVAVGRVDDPGSALEAARAVGLVESSAAGEVRFPHPLVRGAVYNDLSPTRRSGLHRSAAAVTDGVVAVGHRVAAAGGADPVLAGEVETLGVESVAAGRLGAAAGHFQAAAGLWSEPADRDRCVLLGVEAGFGAGDQSRARSSRPVVEGCGDTPLRSYVLGYVEFASGRLPQAETLLAEAVAGLAGAPGGLGARAAAWLGFVRVMLGRWEDAIGPARAGADDAGWTRGMARGTLAVCLNQLGRTDQLHQLLDELAGEAAHERRGELDTLIALGMVKAWTNDLTGAADDLTAVAVRARAGESAHMLVGGLSFLGGAHYRLGHWDEAIVYSELAVSLARDTDQVLALQHAHAVVSCVHAERGHFDIAEGHLATAAALAELLPWWSAAVGVGVARATLAQARGDAAAFRAAVAELLDGPMWANLQADARMGPWLVLAADALLGSHELDQAHEMVAGLEALMASRDLTNLGADAARLRGQLAEDDTELARASYEAGLATPADGPPVPRARLELAHGSLLRRLGDRRDAVDHLRRARQCFAAVEARPLLADCDRELAACGLRAPAGEGHDLLGLTAAELTVAHLVAQGLSNREVAARQYVSVKAVEYHLGHIYAKLGITSRRQLADSLTATTD